MARIGPTDRPWGVLAGLPELASGKSSAAQITAPFPSTLGKALEWLQEHIATQNLDQVYDALLEALSLNLLHFDTSYDTAYDRPVSQSISWLDFTHGITFSNAARVMCTKYPQYWRPALLQMTCFLGRNFNFIDRGIDTEAWRVDEPQVFFAQVRQDLLDHGLRDPIFSAHLVKTSLAVEEEIKHASASCQGALLAALNRFLHSPLKTKHVRRLARQAINLVARDFEADD